MWEVPGTCHDMSCRVMAHNPLHLPQTREHLAKAQRGLPGEGVSEVIQTLVEISQDGTSYSGDLLSTIDVLRNMTEIFRRAYYSPTPGDVQVSSQEHNQDTWEDGWGGVLNPALHRAQARLRLGPERLQTEP